MFVEAKDEYWTLRMEQFISDEWFGRLAVEVTFLRKIKCRVLKKGKGH